MITAKKKCPHCGNEWLARLYSLNKHYCVDCNIMLNWELSKGQVPLLSNSKVNPKEDIEDEN